jgi:multisubunit Na+/H+ antiporter MnhG subunit
MIKSWLDVRICLLGGDYSSLQALLGLSELNCYERVHEAPEMLCYGLTKLHIHCLKPAGP